MTPKYRFTIFNAIEAPAGMVVEEPLGWKAAVLSLERHEVYNSLVEYFKAAFIWYGTARDLLFLIETTQGPDAKPRILVELTFDESTWETVFDGLINLSLLEDFAKTDLVYKLGAPIIPNDFWSKFIKRKSTQVDLQSTVDLDGNAITPMAKIDLPLPSQVMRQTFQRMVGYNPGVDFQGCIGAQPVTNQSYIMFSNDLNVLDEIKTRFDYGCQVADTNSFPPSLLQYFFKTQYAGEYNIDISIRYLFNFSPAMDVDVQWKLAIRTAGELTEYNIGTSQSALAVGTLADDGARTYTNTFTLNAGDEIYVYALLTGDPSPTIDFFPDYDPGGGAVYTAFSIVANTTYPATTVDALYIKDAAENILLNILGGSDIVLSNFFDNCGNLNAILKGKHVRGFSFADKAFSLSFDEWWEGANPLFCLGLGYNKTAGVEHIEIEEVADFFDTTPSLLLSNVPNLVRTHDQSKFYTNIEVGYDIWSAESDGAIDDPQTKHTYATILSTIGKAFKISSKFFAASLGIEQTRRNGVTLDKDWKLDENTIIIALADATPSVETGADFTSVTNLNNAATRYNIRHSVARMFYRWRAWLQAGMQLYVGTVFKFTKGEGNYTMTSTTADTCEETTAIDEIADIDVTTDFVTLSEMYKAEQVPLTWAQYKTIRDNRKKGIGVSSTDTGHLLMYVHKMDYKINDGQANFLLTLGSKIPL